MKEHELTIHQVEHPYEGRVTYHSPGNTIEQALEYLDPFNHQIYWPLRNVIPCLSRMGVHQ